MTMLHAFLSSSYDWARVVPTLAPRYALLLPDFLGFGASEKPLDHSYSLHEQADLVEALWALEGVTSTVVVAHDFAVSITQELLARRMEGRLSVDLAAVHLLNGGVYPHLYRPQAASTALLDPERGPQLAATLTEELFALAVKPTFAGAFDPSEDSADIWHAATRDNGREVATRLASYINDRAAHSERWVAALEQTDVPVSLRVGDARSSRGGGYGGPDPRAPAPRTVPGTRRRGALAGARSVRTGRGRCAERRAAPGDSHVLASHFSRLCRVKRT